MPHPTPTWLKGKREKRRTLKTIDRYIDPDQVYHVIVDAPIWPYKKDKELYAKRDRALISILYLMGCRVNEVLRLTKSQFDFDSDPDFIIVKDFQISKRKQKTLKREGIPKLDVPLPKIGTFAKFTKIFLEYYDEAPEKLFKIGRKRAWAITNYMTGKWCHYFRSQRLSHLVNLFRSALLTSRLMGIKNPQTISHYYKTIWKEHREELKK